MLRKALVVHEATWGRLHLSVSKVLLALADLLLALCRWNEAERLSPGGACHRTTLSRQGNSIQEPPAP